MRWILLLTLCLYTLPSQATLTASQISTVNNYSTTLPQVSATGTKGPVPLLAPPIDDKNACATQACSVMSCEFKSDADEVAKACSGATPAAGACIQSACSSSGCSLRSDLIRVIKSCKESTKDSTKDAPSPHAANPSGECVGQVCGHLGCTFQSDAEEIARACRQASSGCVRALCEQSGCTFKSQALSAIKTCTPSPTDSIVQ